MADKTAFMNNFTVSMQNLTCVLQAKATAPNIEKISYGTPPVFEERKTVDETFLFMPVEVAKELAVSLLHVVGTAEKRAGVTIRLSKDKEACWEAAVKAVDAYHAEQQTREKPEPENNEGHGIII
jgi:hypothetical protein